MSLNISTVAVNLLLQKDTTGLVISEDTLRATIIHLDTYIANIFVEATASCPSYFAFDGQTSAVVNDACESMDITNVESKIVSFDETVKQLQVAVETSVTVEHQHSASAAILVEAFILHQANKLAKRGNFPFGVQVHCMDCLSVRLHWYTFVIVGGSNTDMNHVETAASFGDKTTSHLNVFVGDPKIRSASSHVLVVVVDPLTMGPIEETSRANASKCEDLGDAATAEYYFETLIISTFPADQNQAFAKGLKHALDGNLPTTLLEAAVGEDDFFVVYVPSTLFRLRVNWQVLVVQIHQCWVRLHQHHPLLL